MNHLIVHISVHECTLLAARIHCREVVHTGTRALRRTKLNHLITNAQRPRLAQKSEFYNECSEPLTKGTVLYGPFLLQIGNYGK